MSFKKSFLMVALLMVAAMVFGGCGGGGGDSPTPPTPTALEGKFIDGPVQGLAYSSATQSGTTDANGVFKYKAGEEVVFKIGGVNLPKVAAAATVTPLSYYPTEGTSGANVIKLVRTIMSASENYASENLKIKANPLNGRTGDYTPALFTTMEAAGDIPVTATQAQNHLEGSLLKAYSGDYKGTYSGSESGTWTAKVNASGVVTGTLTNASYTAPITGNVTAAGAATLTGGGSAAGASWTGTLVLATGKFSGAWMNGSYNGTFTGEKTTTPTPTPTPTPDPKIDGTWKITGISELYKGSIRTMTITTRTPEIFPVQMVDNGGTYTFKVNNGGNAKATYRYDDTPSSTGTWTIPTQSGFRKIGDSYEYEYTQPRPGKFIGKLTESNKAVLREEWLDNDGSPRANITELTRVVTPAGQ